MPDKLVLALDNSLDFLNLALAKGGELLEERHTKVDRLSSEVLPVKVSRLLTDHGFSAPDLSLLVVTLGPGSFTGVRVGLAFCKGLSAALGIPLVGVATPDVLALPLAFLDGYYLCPLIDAKRGEVFFSLYRASEGGLLRVDRFHSLKPYEVKEKLRTPCLCFGSGVKLCASFLGQVEGVRRIETGFQRISGQSLLMAGGSGFVLQQQEVKPIYGRKSEAEIKFNVSFS